MDEKGNGNKGLKGGSTMASSPMTRRIKLQQIHLYEDQILPLKQIALERDCTVSELMRETMDREIKDALNKGELNSSTVLIDNRMIKGVEQGKWRKDRLK